MNEACLCTPPSRGSAPVEKRSWSVAEVRELDIPAWICDSEERLVEANTRAEELFGQRQADLRGNPCPSLGLRAGAHHEGRAPVEGRLMNGPSSGRWLMVVPIPLRGANPDGATSTLYLGLDVDRAHRIELYLERVANRSGFSEKPRSWRLTPRENEILSLLASDEDSHGIARQLHVSYATVRNHVQRILAKMGVHSIQEAVALYLLNEPVQVPRHSLAS